MAAPLLSSVWYRVADLKPRLRGNARLHRHVYRSEVWYLLQDQGSGRVNRFSPAARLVISLMDGNRTVARLWEIANKHLGENAPTQDEMIGLLGQLHAADLLQSDVAPDVAELFERGEKEARARVRRAYGNPMAFRVRLWDPDPFLNKFPRLIAFIWSRAGAMIWLAVVLPALFLIPSHWPELSHNLGDRILAVDNLFILYVIFPFLKAFHEMGHASATKAGGGEVHDLGFILLVLLPIPYVEASAASTFRSKYQRALVGAAGVMAELFLAALAFYLWLAVEPGVVRAALFNVMVIAGVSTLLFNGNPLLRYDAYYILADLIEIPNLAARSLRYWGYLFERYILGVRDMGPPDAVGMEKTWFILYGAASTIYRVFISIFIALFIAGQFFFIGVLLALWAVFAMVVLPVAKGIRYLTTSPKLRRQRGKAIAVCAGTLGGLFGFMLLVPVPYHTHAQGVVWLSEQSYVRTGANGFLAEFVARPGSEVSKDDILVRCADPQLVAQLAAAEARVQKAEANYNAEIMEGRTKILLAKERLSHERDALEVVRGKIADLTVRAGTDGVFVVPQMDDMPGRFYKKGETLGYVISPGPKLLRVVVPQEAIARVLAATTRVRVRMVDKLDTIVSARVVRAVPAGDELLPSRALAADGGGEIVTDPRETKGPKAMRRMFQFDVELDAELPANQFGQRGFVRFDHAEAPLAVQWYRGIRLLFLSRFNV